MRINYNVSAMLANNSLARNDMALSKAMERLSSGNKINHAKDNAAGLAIARRMNAQIEGLSAATDNTGDGIGIIEIVDGALSEIHDMLQRMNELAIKASNGPLSEGDREMVDLEFQELADEIERIGATTQFNGQNLMDGTFDLKGYVTTYAQQGQDYVMQPDVDPMVTVEYYSSETPYGLYTCSITPEVDPVTGELTDAPQVTLAGYGSHAWDGEITGEANEDELTLRSGDEFEIRLVLEKEPVQGGAPGEMQFKTTYNNLMLDLTGVGSMTVQIGANEGQTMEIRIPPITRENLGIDESNLRSRDEPLTAKEEREYDANPEIINANKAIDEVAGAISFISAVRSELGALQNRLEHTEATLELTSENMTESYSQIMDTDMAKEMTNYSSKQVISQAATSILAQANERPSQILQLLQ
ncbi:MAG: flagellin [Lachnospiraceae bacterium]|nr:flagellin [Lachnospiraceae bacterium]